MAQKGKGNTVQRVTQIVQPVADTFGLMLWDVRFLKEGTLWYLRIFIDKEGGVDLNSCADFSRAINPLIDEADLIEQTYILEVSSPGIERELTKESHFVASVGKSVLLRTIRPIEGVRDFSGVLKEYQDSVLTLACKEGSELAVKVKETSFVKLDDFNMDDFNER